MKPAKPVTDIFLHVLRQNVLTNIQTAHEIRPTKHDHGLAIYLKDLQFLKYHALRLENYT